MYWSIVLGACAQNHFIPEICRFFGLTVASENPVPARYVSLWDAVAGKLLAHLALPEEAASVAATSFSPLGFGVLRARPVAG